ncbi:MAG: hypothetical protein ACYC8T_10060 [Myxococcaceae bacterium]
MNKKTAAEKKTAALLAVAFKKLSQRLSCPKCKKTRPKDKFGLRVMRRDARGIPVVIRRQSYCATCRR